jgi:hypothetical protein
LKTRTLTVLLIVSFLASCASERQIEKHDTGESRDLCLSNNPTDRRICHDKNSTAPLGPGGYGFEGMTTEEMLEHVEKNK